MPPPPDNLSAEWGILCLEVLLDADIRTNLQLVVRIATKYVEKLRVLRLVQLFYDANSSDGMFSFIGKIIENGAGESLVTAVPPLSNSKFSCRKCDGSATTAPTALKNREGSFQSYCQVSADFLAFCI